VKRRILVCTRNETRIIQRKGKARSEKRDSEMKDVQVGRQRQRKIPERIVTSGRVIADCATNRGSELSGNQVDQR
jgi:hypothetical protein